MTLGNQAHSLIKHAKHHSSSLSPFNDHAINALTRELRFLLSEITHTLSSHTSIPLSQPATLKIQLLHNTIKHYKRCLVAYALNRIHLLTAQSDIDLFSNTITTAENQSQNGMLSSAESVFLNRYRSSIKMHYHDQYPVLDWNSQYKDTGRSVFMVQVRVLEDCGDVVMESGVINLQRGALISVDRGDVDQLVRAGYVELV